MEGNARPYISKLALYTRDKGEQRPGQNGEILEEAMMEKEPTTALPFPFEISSMTLSKNLVKCHRTNYHQDSGS